MNRNNLSKVIIAIIALLIVLLVINIVRENTLKFSSHDSVSPDLSAEETAFIKSGEAIDVYVDPELQYLMTEDSNFIETYLDSIFGNSGVNIKLTKDPAKAAEADARLCIVTDELRADDSIRFTSPIMQVEGALFVKREIENSPLADELMYKGLCIEDRVKNLDFARINYNHRPIEFTEVSGDEQAVEQAVGNENIDFILGDRSAISFFLGDNPEYIPLEKNVYEENVCFATAADDTVVYGIINAYVNKADKHNLSYLAKESWGYGDAPMYQRQSYINMSMIGIIICLSVLIVFLLYYAANRNLYYELENRMAKLRASRKELQTTFNGIDYFLAEIDLDGGIIDVNRAFFNYLGRSETGNKIWDVIHLDDSNRDDFMDMYETAKSGEIGRSMETNVGTHIYLLEMFPIEGAAGKVEKLLLMCEDVTNMRMAEKQMLQDNKMIAVGQLASGIAHEIRNPLGIIRNYCYVLKTMKNEEIQGKAIEQIENAVAKSGAIIETLLDFSRVSPKKLAEINVKEHVESMILLNEGTLKKKDIQVDIKCETEIISTIVVESFDMVLINLINNAIDAMDDQGHLEIDISRNYETFNVCVRDNGIGMDEETMKDIFNPFFTTKIDSGGTGLGLYIVYNEIGKMNGKITVESTKGEGTAFKVVLPIITEVSEV